MAFEIAFSELDAKQTADHVTISQKILSIEAELVKISTERANAEVAWRKKENYLQMEKGKLELERRALMSAIITETA